MRRPRELPPESRYQFSRDYEVLTEHAPSTCMAYATCVCAQSFAAQSRSLAMDHSPQKAHRSDLMLFIETDVIGVCMVGAYCVYFRRYLLSYVARASASLHIGEGSSLPKTRDRWMTSCGSYRGTAPYLFILKERSAPRCGSPSFFFPYKRERKR